MEEPKYYSLETITEAINGSGLSDKDKSTLVDRIVALSPAELSCPSFWHYMTEGAPEKRGTYILAVKPVADSEPPFVAQEYFIPGHRELGATLCAVTSGAAMVYAWKERDDNPAPPPLEQPEWNLVEWNAILQKDEWSCPVCMNKEWRDWPPRFCPHCGTRMKLPTDGSEE